MFYSNGKGIFWFGEFPEKQKTAFTGAAVLTFLVFSDQSKSVMVQYLFSRYYF